MKNVLALVIIMTGIIYIQAAPLCAEQAKATDIVTKPVEAVAEGTGTIVGSSLEVSEAIISGSLGAVKDGANEILPENMELVAGNENEEDTRPRIKMDF